MNLRYKTLFSIEILNDYFTTAKWKEVSFIPLPETRKLITDNGMQVRQVQNQLLLITRVDKDFKPLRLPDFYSKFSFILQPGSPGYINFTNLPQGDTGLKCFHLHNLHENVSGGVNYLSSPIREYSNTTIYKPGDYARGSDGKTYQSIKKNTGNQLPDNNITASKNYWVLQDDIQFVNDYDSSVVEAQKIYPLSFTGPVCNLKTSVKRTSHKINVYACNFTTNGFDRLVYSCKVTTDTPSDRVQVVLDSLASGKYKVQVEDEIYFVYMVSSGESFNIPMFIEIFNLPKTYLHSLIKADDTLKNIKYTVHFASRRVFWRYRTRTTAIDTIKDSSGDFKFKSDGSKYFISRQPIPLSDAPRKTISANTGNLVIVSPLPNPQADRLLNKRDDVYTTEIYVNY